MRYQNYDLPEEEILAHPGCKSLYTIFTELVLLQHELINYEEKI